ncbi:MAG: hypothetical protein MUE98_00570 [Rhodobacteraceae bacterium]|jgi:hypothetical protein|nr:hypothetical protein [Paracoccaceae bacterium]
MGLIQRIFGGTEKRASGSGFTAEVIAAREAYVSGRRGIAELTATAQTCIGMWESGFALADVQGAPGLDRVTMALLGRSLAFRGEAVFLIREDRLVPASDWDVATRDGRPSAYRLSIPEAGGGRSETALAAEVLHCRIGVDPVAPWYGSAPLKRAQLTAGLLNAVELALAEVYETAPIGSQVLPLPEMPEGDLNKITRGFRARRGSVMVRESVNVTAAGGPAPAQDWQPRDLTPDLGRAMPIATMAAARDSVLAVFGILPALFNPQATGPLVREAQRHLATWVLQPMAELVAEEATAKLGTKVEIDVHRPLQSFDAGGSARALAGIVEALARAKEAGLSDAQVAAAFGALDWKEALE